MEKLGVAIIGCGYWGINHVRVFNELPQARVVAVCDQRVERLQEVAKRFPGVALTTQTEDVLRQEGVQAAIVCTEATNHFSAVQQCLQSGKHVLVEKPITTKVSEAEQLVSLARAMELTLMVGHTFLYNAGIRKVKEYVQQASVGHLYYLYACRTNLGPIRHDVNALWDLAPHDVAIFNYLLDRSPDWVSAVGARVLHNGHEDVGFITLSYPDDILGHVHVSWADPNKVREIVVVGSNKRIVFDDTNALERVRVFEKGVTPAAPEASSFGEYHFLMRDGDILSPRINGGEPLKNECQHFIDCVTQGLCPLTNGQAGLEVVRIMEAVDRSMALRGAPVQLVRHETATDGNLQGDGTAPEATGLVREALLRLAMQQSSPTDAFDTGRYG